MVSGLDRQAGAEPVAEIVFADASGGDVFDQPNRLELVEVNLATVVGQEEASGDPGRSLIAIGEAVIAGDTVTIGCGQCCCVRVAMGCKVSGPGQCRLHSASIAESSADAMFCDLAIVDGMDQCFTGPSSIGHFASARRISRSSCMMASAIALCRWKSGSSGVSHNVFREDDAG